MLENIINLPAGLKEIYKLAQDAIEGSQKHCPGGLRAKINKDIDALQALGAAQKEMCARVPILKGCIEGLQVLNLSEGQLSDTDPEEIGQLNREERIHAVHLAANILAHFAALEEGICPRNPALV